MPPCFVTRHWMEGLCIHSRWNDHDFSRVNAIILDQLSPFGRALGNNAIYLLHGGDFGGDALQWAAIHRSLMAVFGFAESMENLHCRNMQAALQLGHDPARHPEIAVKKIVTDIITRHKTQECLAKIGHVLPKIIFREKLRWTGTQVDHPYTRGIVHDLRHIIAITAGEDINSIATLRQIAAHLIDVDILSAGILASQ